MNCCRRTSVMLEICILLTLLETIWPWIAKRAVTNRSSCSRR
ncbi:hypothetical protein OPV43_106 [Saccharomyces cerevisiae synthetic construct]|uniref:Putative uncharacterized protein YCR038W-A n=2 Tax=Saccharomyces cerevisiae TaxID=4932 RepID=YC038_YEAST|nr:RecName: Full=Putative uncharacterized protein YCR038W-A [Saccharomyces cerevisiae S288C]AHV79302.1 hypothetical protein [synthetic construct]KZV12888.1 hypothetical protein WN66_00709 [Saccharomyces cerevisiae]UZT75856.1 hypothetical protein OPV43_106 [Saccharomyces cerevisiae synthetic construct]CAY78245.1 EC1118_1C17_1211p [Saccharomyces cerevisiae EC1118]WNV71719.1 hypothetical protein O6U65_0565 [Saccharomyces cerevisiae synthetic construct]